MSAPFCTWFFMPVRNHKEPEQAKAKREKYGLPEYAALPLEYGGVAESAGFEPVSMKLAYCQFVSLHGKRAVYLNFPPNEDTSSRQLPKTAILTHYPLRKTNPVINLYKPRMDAKSREYSCRSHKPVVYFRFISFSRARSIFIISSNAGYFPNIMLFILA